MGRFINPFSDWGFKLIFGQEITKDLLISFLNDLLQGEHVITDITFKDKEQLPEAKDKRGVIYDVYCTTDKGQHIIVEMQNRYQEHFVDRSLYYASRAIVGQGVKGEWDYHLAPVYTVCFMNFNLNDDTPKKFRTDVCLTDIETGKVFSENLRMIYLMLPLFTKEEEECENDFERWIYVLKNMNTLDRIPFMARNAVFQKLAAIADITALSKEEREKYDESIKIMRDNIAAYEGALLEGKMQIAKKLLQKGMPIEDIVDITELSTERVQTLA